MRHLCQSHHSLKLSLNFIRQTSQNVISLNARYRISFSEGKARWLRELIRFNFNFNFLKFEQRWK